MIVVKDNQRLTVVPEGMVDELVVDQLIKKSSTYVTYSYRGQTLTKPDKEFFIDYGKDHRLILSANQLSSVISTFEENHIKYNLTESTKKNSFIPINAKVLNNYDFRDDLQREYNDFLLVDRKSYLCSLQTGKGKTGATILSLMFRKNLYRFAILTPPRFHNIWIDAFEKFTDITRDNIYIVSGRSSLMGLKTLDKQYKAVIISPPTIREYLKEHISKVRDGIDTELEPDEILDYIGCDHLIIDEVHEDFAGNYVNVLALNPYKYIALTATYSSTQDPRKVVSHKEHFIPKKNRMAEAELDKYMTMVFCQYNVELTKDLKFINSAKKWYSHILLEESMMKLSARLFRYFDVIIHFIRDYYIRDKGYRLLVLFARRDITMKFRDYISKHIEFKHLKCSTYLRGDPEENLQSDIIIATGKKGGTGVDIDKVQVTVNTISTKSEYTGKQFPGRNRKIDGVEQYYLSIFAGNIPPQANYKRQNMKLLSDLGKEVKVNFYSDITV